MISVSNIENTAKAIAQINYDRERRGWDKSLK
jgi:hypothetical protein